MKRRGADPRNWRAGAYLTHRSNPELGVGRVTAIDGRHLVVAFPRAGTTLRLAADTDALVPVELASGRLVRVASTGREARVQAVSPDGLVEIEHGLVLHASELWPVVLDGDLLERLIREDLDEVEDFRIRLDVLRLLAIRQADGLGSFLGGRVRLFPHQLHVAGRACASTPVRWLLADEVGLGKTIEASLILNRLVHTGQVERCLVVAPDTLTIQWLGELWRKYHQVFTLLDEARLADVARDFGARFNPFDVHRRVVMPLELLVTRPELTDYAVSAGIDLLVVDEAQRLRRAAGHPGEPAWRAVAPIAALGRHVLLLSATPLEDDAHGFFRLLQLLRPDEFPEDVSFETRLAEGAPLPPCTSATRRVDIGGLPPRHGIPVHIGDLTRSTSRLELEATLRRMTASHEVARRAKSSRIRRALSSGAALRTVLGPDEQALRRQASEADDDDPRVAWLLGAAPAWRHAGQKTLVFTAHRETLELLRETLSHRVQVASGVFHEDLSTARRDTEVARFREPDGPSILVSTECGGEGRNFEFCQRLVLFDLPWKPSVVEQRIGRLDRIGRRLPVEIVYFVPPSGIGLDVVRVFEVLGLFSEPLAGLEPQLAHIEDTLEEIALDPDARLTDARLDALVDEARSARSRIREAAFHELHRDPYRASMASSILSRVPDGLDALNEQVVVTACERLGFSIERQRGRAVYTIELGSGALVDSLPGVPGGSSFLGSFDRDEAVERETLDFFASGHPLVEGLFAHFDDSPFGRAVRLEMELGDDRGAGLVAFYRTPHGFEVVALDTRGGIRSDWADAFRRPPYPIRGLNSEAGARVDWARLVRRVGAHLDASRRPYALATVLVRPAAG